MNLFRPVDRHYDTVINHLAGLLGIFGLLGLMSAVIQWEAGVIVGSAGLVATFLAITAFVFWPRGYSAEQKIRKQ